MTFFAKIASWILDSIIENRAFKAGQSNNIMVTLCFP